MIDTVQTDKSPVRLSELTKEIADVVNGHFGNKFYWVIADITNHRVDAKKGYHYFNLAEKHGPGKSNVTKIGCSAFSVGSESIRNFESYTKQRFGDNIEVMVKIKVDYSIEFGLRTILQDIDVAFTIGNLEKLKQATLARLLQTEAAHIQQIGNDYITTNKKLSYPMIIKGVALITSRESEGYTDFCHTLSSNKYGYKFHLFKFFSKVQSETASDEIVDCLKTIYTRYRNYVDVVVICRGGGAQTDFLTFNQFNLCRAVARFPIPIITGIGHHTNQSLVDILARTETKTPTQAAEFIVNHCHTAELNVTAFQQNIAISAQRLLARKQESLQGMRLQLISLSRHMLQDEAESVTRTNNAIINNTHRLLARSKDEMATYRHAVVSNTFRLLGDHRYELVRMGSILTSKPVSIVSIRKNNLENEVARLKSFSTKYLVNQSGYIGHFNTLFNHLDIDKTLAKGFAIVRKNGKVIANPDQISVGDNIDLQLQKSTILTKVTDKKNGTGPDL